MNYEQDSLTLGLGFPSTTTTTIKPTTTTTTVKPLSCNLNEPSLTLSLLGGEAAPCSAASSMSNVVVSVKRERESGSNTSDELDNIIDHRGYSRGSDEEEDGGCHVNATRKKLRLNKQQSAMLEESFKQQSTLNPQKQKQALADRLNLRPRQVEVWFQNRRARTKLKQTEVDCEYLKKYCETLSDENMKLQKEVQELKALKSAQPFYMHLPAATLTMCPSCERIGTGPPNNNIVAPTTPANNNNPFSMGPKTHPFFTSVPTRPLLVDN